jgi:hypothetical protein
VALNLRPWPPSSIRARHTTGEIQCFYDHDNSRLCSPRHSFSNLLGLSEATLTFSVDKSSSAQRRRCPLSLASFRREAGTTSLSDRSS